MTDPATKPTYSYHVLPALNDPNFHDTFDAIYASYEKCFPIAEERETKENFLAILERNDDPELKTLVNGREQWVYVTDQSGNIVGASNFDVFANKPALDGINGTLQDIYTFVEEDHRKNGVFDGLIAQREAIATEFIKEAYKDTPDFADGKQPTLITFAEQNDPLQLTQGEYQAEVESGMDPVVRRQIYEKRGFRNIGMPYIQPALEEGADALTMMNLVARGAPGSEIPSQIVTEHLRNFFELSFDGVKLDDPSIAPMMDMLASNPQLQLMETGRFKDLAETLNTSSVEAAKIGEEDPLHVAFPEAATQHYRDGFAESMAIDTTLENTHEVLNEGVQSFASKFKHTAGWVKEHGKELLDPDKRTRNLAIAGATVVGTVIAKMALSGHNRTNLDKQQRGGRE